MKFKKWNSHPSLKQPLNLTDWNPHIYLINDQKKLNQKKTTTGIFEKMDEKHLSRILGIINLFMLVCVSV